MERSELRRGGGVAVGGGGALRAPRPSLSGCVRVWFYASQVLLCDRHRQQRNKQRNKHCLRQSEVSEQAALDVRGNKR